MQTKELYIDNDSVSFLPSWLRVNNIPSYRDYYYYLLSEGNNLFGNLSKRLYQAENIKVLYTKSQLNQSEFELKHRKYLI